MQNKPWKERQASGATFAGAGAIILLATEPVMKLFSGGPTLLSALVQIVMAILGPLFLIVGLYRLGTKDKNPSSRSTAKKWLAVGLLILVGLVAVYGYVTSGGPNSGSTSASAQKIDWIQIDANGTGDFLYVANLKRDGALVEYWTKVQFATPRKMGDIQSSVLLDQFVANCTDKTLSHMKSHAIYDVDKVGTFTIDPSRAGRFVPAPTDPGHPDSISVRYACGLK